MRSESQVTLKAHLKCVGVNSKWDHWDGHSAYRCLREMCVFHSVNLVLLNFSTSAYQQAQSGNVKKSPASYFSAPVPEHISSWRGPSKIVHVSLLSRKSQMMEGDSQGLCGTFPTPSPTRESPPHVHSLTLSFIGCPLQDRHTMPGVIYSDVNLRLNS